MAIIPDTRMAEDSLRQKRESVAFQILLMYKSHQPTSTCTEQRMLEIASHCVVFLKRSHLIIGKEENAHS